MLIFFPISLWCQHLLPISAGEIVNHSYYTLSYSEEHEQANWVYYELTPELINGTKERTGDFRPDPQVSTGSAQLADYKGSGYHRGHLCPAGSMDLNTASMSESFFLSNMSPQHPSFNTGHWKMLESQVRKWVNMYEKIIVISGPIFKDNIAQIGINHITIPGYYYKVIYCPNKEQMIAFVMPNKKLSHPINAYEKTVDNVELLTGIDFFHDMDDTLEDKLESNSNTEVWDFKRAKTVSPSIKIATTSAQCKGVAKSSGQRCKQNTKNANEYCHAHQSQAPGIINPKEKAYTGQCKATTQSGAQCKRKSSDGSEFCWQHK